MKNSMEIKATRNQFIEQAVQIKFSSEDSYLRSYNHFVDFFRSSDDIDERMMTIGIHFTYGWMPKIFKFQKGNLETVLPILNQARTSKALEESQLLTLKAYFNNSLVGTSKLLHFINPEQYAIWDSHVYYFLYERKPNAGTIGNPFLYLQYLRLVNEWSSEDCCHEVQKKFESQFKYSISKLRAAELVVFYAGKEKARIDKTILAASE